MAKKTETNPKPVTPAKRAAKPAVAKEKTAKPAAPKAKTPKAAKPKTPAAPKAPAAPTFTTDDIALRAYFIGENRRAQGLHGDEHQDWVEAERQLIAESAEKKKLKKA